MNEYIFFGSVIVFTILSFIYVLWHFILAHFVTLIHEIGHAFTGVVGGGFLRKIKINFDASGETQSATRGGIFAIGSFISALAGYPAPFILGLLIIKWIEMGQAQIAAWVLLIIGIVTFLFIRNWFGLLITLIWLALIFILGFMVMPDIRIIFLTIMSALLIVGGLKDLFGLTRMYIRKRAEGTDISIIKESYGIPMIISLLSMYAITIAGFYFIIF